MQLAVMFALAVMACDLPWAAMAAFVMCICERFAYYVGPACDFPSVVTAAVVMFAWDCMAAAAVMVAYVRLACD